MEHIAHAHVNHGPDVAPLFVFMFLVFGILFALVVMAIKALIFCKVFSKAGYCWALGLLILVPIANIVMAFYLAFADWPVLRELRQIKQQQAKM